MRDPCAPRVDSASDLETPEERFISVLRYYLAGWHVKPKGVKKPYNPVLGEFFRCRYDYSDGTSAYYIAEQVSHHPPVSAWSVSQSPVMLPRLTPHFHMCLYTSAVTVL